MCQFCTINMCAKGNFYANFLRQKVFVYAKKFLFTPKFNANFEKTFFAVKSSLA